MAIQVVRTIREIRENVEAAKRAGKKTCVVPTMGGLHAGHLSLIKKAEEVSDYIVVTLFVNPTQFNNPDDFENYPGDEAADLQALSQSAANIVFAPSATEMYPDGFSTSVNVDAAGGILCDAHRPGHFDGVATIVAKLFLQTGTDYACFGEKDFQQLFIIGRMVRDLNIPIEIIPVETVREEDGLALSSRNARLNDKERKLAPILNQHMRKVADAVQSGMSATSACSDAIESLQTSSNFKVEYLEMRSTDTLQLVDDAKHPSRLFAAAWLGDVRLIDNIAV